MTSICYLNAQPDPKDPDGSHGGSMKRLHVLVIDDHALFREGLRLLLRHVRPGIQVDLASNVAGAEAVLERAHLVDLILLDLQLPGMQGVQALHALRELHDNIPIVVLSGNEDPDVIRLTIDNGAMGFIQKSGNSEEMMSAIETVLAGGISLPATCLLSVTRTLAERDQVLREVGVSTRQGAVLARIAQGKTNKAIAEELCISDLTVKTHVQNLFNILGVRSRGQLVYVLARLGWRGADLA
ncbi:DNA-binding response regulator [Paraburkholderia unamae]|uniref:response regulator n=1 Tax=Paraburkholderia unamae TaxID=219649 RepID=UPI001CAF7B25|nr:response regulator transcription factor [Paraburkholderia unamae]CAG9243324.1 DNA-binding response regulator [Paraburkholderia unamae]